MLARHREGLHCMGRSSHAAHHHGLQKRLLPSGAGIVWAQADLGQTAGNPYQGCANIGRGCAPCHTPQAVRTAINAQSSGDCGRIMIVLLTDGRANVSLAKSNEDPDALAEGAPKPSQVLCPYQRLVCLTMSSLLSGIHAQHAPARSVCHAWLRKAQKPCCLQKASAGCCAWRERR